MSARPRIAFVSRELAPFGGGGIGAYVVATARVLEPVAEVTILTTERHRRRYEELAAVADEAVAGLRVEFVPEPRGWEVEDYHGSRLHRWSANAFDALIACYPEGGPDLIEFPDFLGEGFVTVQAARSLDPRLRRTTVCVRLHTTAEITDVLNGHLPAEFEPRLTYELERYALGHCDHVLWPGGDVLGTYERRLGALPDPVRIRHPVALPPPDVGAPSEPDGDRDPEALRLLYAGRLERRKGVLELARAMSAISGDGIHLTIAGADTDTAPLGQSMRAVLELMVGADQRVDLREPAPPGAMPALIASHDVVVVPSLWECWPTVGLEALAGNRPLLATPVGGLTEIVQPDRSGWLADGTGADDLARSIEGLAADPGRVAALRRERRPRAVFDELTDPDRVREAYAELVAASGQRLRARAGAGAVPLVSVVVPYYRLDRFLEQTIRSVEAQTHMRTEVIVVNDGSFEGPDGVLLELADRHGFELITQPNSGLGAARNAGIAQARGGYVLLLDADNLIAPTFVERCVEVLEHDRSLAYATSWARYIDDEGEQWGSPGRGLRPLGNWSSLVEERNVAGDAAAVYRRDIFDHRRFSRELTSFEDWAFYRELRRAGLVGHVIPEALLDYRIRDDSMMRELGAPNAERIEGEIRARLAEREVEWTAS